MTLTLKRREEFKIYSLDLFRVYLQRINDDAATDSLSN